MQVAETSLLAFDANSSMFVTKTFICMSYLSVGVFEKDSPSGSKVLSVFEITTTSASLCLWTDTAEKAKLLRPNTTLLKSFGCFYLIGVY